MTLRFPYRRSSEERIQDPHARRTGLIAWIRQLFGQPPTEPSFGASDTAFRPLVPIRIRGPVAARTLKSALLDTGSLDTLFPAALAEKLGIVLGSLEKKTIRWRGRPFGVEFHSVKLELVQGRIVWRWLTRVGFTPAPLPYAILGQRGCLDFLDATFLGAEQVVELSTNRQFPGTVVSGT